MAQGRITTPLGQLGAIDEDEPMTYTPTGTPAVFQKRKRDQFTPDPEMEPNLIPITRPLAQASTVVQGPAVQRRGRFNWVGPDRDLSVKPRTAAQKTEDRRKAQSLRQKRIQGREAGYLPIRGNTATDVGEAARHTIGLIREDEALRRAYGQDPNQILIRERGSYVPYTQNQVSAMEGTPYSWNPVGNVIKGGKPKYMATDGLNGLIPLMNTTRNLTHAYAHYVDPTRDVPKRVIKMLRGRIKVAEDDKDRAFKDAHKALRKTKYL